MSSASIVCEKWVKIPDLNTHCVQEVATTAVHEFNKKYGNSLKFDSIYEGWYWEIAPCIVKYKLHIKALDFLGRLLNYRIIVHEEIKENKKIRTVEVFIVLVTDGHFVGDIVVKEVKWVKIPNLCDPFIILVAKFALEEFNKIFGDHLTYDSIFDGWYGEIGQDNIKFHLYLKAKDKDGHVGIYHVIVRVDHSLTLKIKTLISFKIILVTVTLVQVIIKFVVEELKKLFGIVLIFDSIIKEGSYIELGPNGIIRYHLVIKARDILGRLLYFELIVEKHGNTIKIVSIIVIATPGHCVGPTKPPSEKNWVKIHCLTIPFIQDLGIFASKEIEIKSGESLKFDSIYEAWYNELGGDDIEFRLHLHLKDCLGRVQKYEAIVLVKHFFSITIKIVKIFISYKRLTGCGA